MKTQARAGRSAGEAGQRQGTTEPEQSPSSHAPPRAPAGAAPRRAATLEAGTAAVATRVATAHEVGNGGHSRCLVARPMTVAAMTAMPRRLARAHVESPSTTVIRWLGSFLQACSWSHQRRQVTACKSPVVSRTHSSHPARAAWAWRRLRVRSWPPLPLPLISPSASSPPADTASATIILS